MEWKESVETALRMERTPLYIFRWETVEEAVRELDLRQEGLAMHHWLSLKTQPVKALLEAWRQTGRGVEVVSEYELRAARDARYDTDKILVNGVGKHAWLPGYSEFGMRVHLDSLAEVYALRELAAKHGWRVGARLRVSQEHDPDEPEFGGQFGLAPEEFVGAVASLRDVGVDIEGVHFHLRSNVESPEVYGHAIDEVRQVCEACDVAPRYVDCGGGLPVAGECANGGVGEEFDVERYMEILRKGVERLPTVQEVWLENGRFMTSRSGVLVVRVVDVKEREECRYIICDGGRTNHALVSDWETHHLEVIPERSGDRVLSTVCGPTCMAYDRLCRVMLPGDVRPGDALVWHNAGAYHVPWETRFSCGLAAVLWEPRASVIEKIRGAESFEEWWGHWAEPRGG